MTRGVGRVRPQHSSRPHLGKPVRSPALTRNRRCRPGARSGPRSASRSTPMRGVLITRCRGKQRVALRPSAGFLPLSSGKDSPCATLFRTAALAGGRTMVAVDAAGAARGRPRRRQRSLADPSAHRRAHPQRPVRLRRLRPHRRHRVRPQGDRRTARRGPRDPPGARAHVDELDDRRRLRQQRRVRRLHGQGGRPRPDHGRGPARVRRRRPGAAAEQAGQRHRADGGPDPGQDRRQDFANVIGQAFAAQGLSVAGSGKADEAVRFLLKQQCAGLLPPDFAAKTARTRPATGATPPRPRPTPT